VILIIKNIIITQNQLNQGYEPGLGGIAWLPLGIITVTAIFIDIILSEYLTTKQNWIVQSIVVLFFMSYLYFM
jgi:hypothetical protein